jgi:hypothetical protein
MMISKVEMAGPETSSSRPSPTPIPSTPTQGLDVFRGNITVYKFASSSSFMDRRESHVAAGTSVRLGL